MVMLSELADAFSVADQGMLGMITKLMTGKSTRATDSSDIKQ
jgi:hypothetical protein